MHTPLYKQKRKKLKYHDILVASFFVLFPSVLKRAHADQVEGQSINIHCNDISGDVHKHLLILNLFIEL